MSCIYCLVGKGSWWWVWWASVRLLRFVPTVLKHWSEPVPTALINVWEPWAWTLRTSLTTTTGGGSVPVSDNCPKLLLNHYSVWVVGWELFDCTIKGASKLRSCEWVVVGWELFNQASKCELNLPTTKFSLFLPFSLLLLTYFLTYTQNFHLCLSTYIFHSSHNLFRCSRQITLGAHITTWALNYYLVQGSLDSTKYLLP